MTFKRIHRKEKTWSKRIKKFQKWLNKDFDPLYARSEYSDTFNESCQLN